MVENKNKFIEEIFKRFEELYNLSDGCIIDKLMLFSYMVYSGLGNFSQLDLKNIRKHEIYDEDLETNLKMMKKLSDIFQKKQTDAVRIEIND